MNALYLFKGYLSTVNDTRKYPYYKDGKEVNLWISSKRLKDSLTHAERVDEITRAIHNSKYRILEYFGYDRTKDDFQTLGFRVGPWLGSFHDLRQSVEDNLQYFKFIRLFEKKKKEKKTKKPRQKRKSEQLSLDLFPQERGD